MYISNTIGLVRKTSYNVKFQTKFRPSLLIRGVFRFDTGSVLLRQCCDTNQNIKRSLYCRVLILKAKSINV